MLVLRLISLAAAALTLLGACTSAVEGQSRPTEVERPTVRIGIGPGWSLLRTPRTESSGPGMIAVEKESRLLGISGFVGFATEVNDHFSVGLEASGWTGTTDFPSRNRRRTQLGAHGVGYFYPTLQSSFFVKGGLGAGVVAIDTDDGGGEDSGAGLGYLMGVGYDIPLWSETVLSMYVDVPFVRRFRDGVPNVVQIGVAVAPEQTSAQEPPRQDHASVAVADSTPDGTFLRHALMSAVGSGAGVGAGFALARATDDGAGGSVAPVTFVLVGSIVGSSALMALTDDRLSFDPALGASTVGVLGGLAATWMVVQADNGGFEEGVVVGFSVGQALVSATVADGLRY